MNPRPRVVDVVAQAWIAVAILFLLAASFTSFSSGISSASTPLLIGKAGKVYAQVSLFTRTGRSPRSTSLTSIRPRVRPSSRPSRFLPPLWGYGVWMALQIVLAALLARALGSLAGTPEQSAEERRTALALALLAMGVGVHANLAEGQINLLIVWLLAMALAAFEQGSLAPRGIFLGGSAAHQGVSPGARGTAHRMAGQEFRRVARRRDGRLGTPAARVVDSAPRAHRWSARLRARLPRLLQQRAVARNFRGESGRRRAALRAERFFVGNAGASLSSRRAAVAIPRARSSARTPAVRLARHARVRSSRSGVARPFGSGAFCLPAGHRSRAAHGRRGSFAVGRRAGQPVILGAPVRRLGDLGRRPVAYAAARRARAGNYPLSRSPSSVP